KSVIKPEQKWKKLLLNRVFCHPILPAQCVDKVIESSALLFLALLQAQKIRCYPQCCRYFMPHIVSLSSLKVVLMKNWCRIISRFFDKKPLMALSYSAFPVLNNSISAAGNKS